MAAVIDLDVDGALRRVGGDRELLVRIIDFVVEDSPEYLSRMKSALKSGEFTEVERAAHSLKGLVSNLHCKAVQDKALEVEALAHNEDRAGMGSAIEILGRLTQEMMLKVYETRRSLEAQLRTS